MGDGDAGCAVVTETNSACGRLGCRLMLTPTSNAAIANPAATVAILQNLRFAEDTVVFYDRKSSLPSGKGPEPGRKQSGRN